MGTHERSIFGNIVIINDEFEIPRKRNSDYYNAIVIYAGISKILPDKKLYYINKDINMVLKYCKNAYKVVNIVEYNKKTGGDNEPISYMFTHINDWEYQENWRI